MTERPRYRDGWPTGYPLRQPESNAHLAARVWAETPRERFWRNLAAWAVATALVALGAWVGYAVSNPDKPLDWLRGMIGGGAGAFVVVVMLAHNFDGTSDTIS